MNLKAVDAFYEQKTEPLKGCLLALRFFILDFNSLITEEWKYRMPFFCYKGKMFCYLWMDKKSCEPYIGIVEGNKIDHPLLERGDRSRMKILRVNPLEDLPLERIEEVFNQALFFYK